MAVGVDLLMGLGGANRGWRVEAGAIGQLGPEDLNRRADHYLLGSLTEKKDSGI
jgi:hypothetical protein